MALTLCTECGNQISEAAKFCSKCGHPIKKDIVVLNNFRRKFTRILLIFITSWIIGCISTKTDPTKIYLIFSVPVAITHIAAQGLGALGFSFLLVWPIIYFLGKFRKSNQTFGRYFFWAVMLAILSLLPNIR
jgi:zinc-ribbon domain